MKVWVTKYALTKGILECWGEVDEDKLYVTVSFGSGNHSWRQYFKMGRDAHLTREAAVAKAHEMRMRRIASLQKQIANLEQMTFIIQRGDNDEHRRT